MNDAEIIDWLEWCAKNGSVDIGWGSDYERETFKMRVILLDGEWKSWTLDPGTDLRKCVERFANTEGLESPTVARRRKGARGKGATRP